MPYSGKKTSPNVVRVRKAPLVACLTCPLCSNLLRDATTISECLHTFCRECIYERLSDEEANCCPMCDVYLGCAPLEKLRADAHLNDVRSKLFPVTLKRKNVSNVSPLTSQPARRKERSLSSLGLVPSSSNQNQPAKRSKAGKNTAKEASYTDSDENQTPKRPRTGKSGTKEASYDGSEENQASKRSKGGKYATKESSHTDSEEKEVKVVESKKKAALSRKPTKEVPEKQPSTPVAPRSRLPLSSSAKGSNTKNGKDKRKAKEELRSPLSYLAELADSDAPVKAEKAETDSESNRYFSEEDLNAEEEEEEEEEEDEEDDEEDEEEEAEANPHVYADAINRFAGSIYEPIHDNGKDNNNWVRSEWHPRPDPCQTYEQLERQTQSNGEAVDKSGILLGSRDLKANSVWFALQAADNQTEGAALPQIQTPFVRITDGKLPVSLVKKYLACKLDLKSETEVEITCRGQPIVSSLPLESVWNIWLATADLNLAAPKLTPTNDFLMVLTYRRSRRPDIVFIHEKNGV